MYVYLVYIKFSKLPKCQASVILELSKHTRVPINHERRQQVHTIVYSLYTQENYSIVVFPPQSSVLHSKTYLRIRH